ncbi:hypothetical protein PDESU_05501 [Pontiella desulfatans]|uniref:Uncharacterized protein n=1 Tax=Pontiella desulfatans TaxID=2750659 RepID=A0A6C2UAI8_PONDE|nr:hypothetical protein [Pontiella desulfatans]VGO16909.1 hypothetical protein PDESU_05501 [Pontiella desulfatans]
MDYEKQLLIEARAAIRQFPGHRCEIIDLYTLAVGEIEEGGSAAHEYELFMDSISAIRKETLTGA